MPENPSRERLLRAGFAGLLIALGVLAAWRGIEGRYDFHHFYLDARYVWEHRALNPVLAQPATDETRNLPFYLPVVPLLLAPLTALGRVPAAIVWSAAQMAALAYSLAVLRRWVGSRPAGGTPGALVLATVFALPALYEAARFNQLSYFVLALLLGGANALDRERPRLAGVFFGVATVLKLLPGIFLLWLLLKRRWSAALACVATITVLALVPPTLVFGLEKARAYHREWFEYNARGDAACGMLRSDLPEHFIDRRNESIGQVLARWTWLEHPFRVAWQPLKLEPQTCKRLADGISAALLLALLALTRRPWRNLTLERRHAEAAVFAIAMLALSPLVRQYYLVWALPGLVVFAGWAVGGSDEPGRSKPRVLGWIGLAVWLGGMALWPWQITRVCGAHLLMLLTLGALLVLVRRPGRDAAAKVTPAVPA
jgi:alpha-1,2-mannosyltransferase